MPNIPLPPVPQFLRETLKDYPELIQQLQDGLNRIVNVMADRISGTPPFERAIWRLEDTLSAMYEKARDELDAAEQSGDSQAIHRAKIKDDAVSEAYHVGGSDLDELRNYFETYKGAFE
jgi:hypothetical protein